MRAHADRIRSVAMVASGSSSGVEGVASGCSGLLFFSPAVDLSILRARPLCLVTISKEVFAV